MGVKADHKVVVTGEHPLTPTKLAAALADLYANGVPEDALVNVTKGTNEWAVFSTWSPEVRTGLKVSADPTPAGLRLEEDAEVTARKIQEERGRSGRWLTCSVCGERITPMAGQPGEYVHMVPPPAATDHLARLDTQG